MQNTTDDAVASGVALVAGIVKLAISPEPRVHRDGSSLDLTPGGIAISGRF